MRTKHNFRSLCLAIQTTLLVLGANAQNLWNVDFGENWSRVQTGFAATGKSTGDFWNSWTHPWENFVETRGLRTADGLPSGVDMTVANAAGQWNNLLANPMYDSYVYSHDRSNPITVTLTNLPAGNYELYLYGHAGPNLAVANSIFQVLDGVVDHGRQATTKSQDWDSPVWQEGRQYVVFRNVQPGPGGTLTIRVFKDGWIEPYLNGLQIVQTCGLGVTGQPDNQHVSLGDPVTFSVGAVAPGPVSYQWQFNGADIAGATGSNLTFTATTPSQAGVYSVRITGADCLLVVAGSLNFKTQSPNFWNIDFGEGPLKSGYAAIGQSDKDVWNRYIHPGQASVTIPVLNAADGRLTSVGLIVTNATLQGGNSVPDAMFADYITAAPGAGPFSVTLTNLPAGVYDFYCYGHGGSFDAAFNSAFELVSGGVQHGPKSTASNGAWFSPIWQEGIQYVVFREVVVSAENRAVTIITQGDGGPQGALNGIQFVQRNGLALDERLLSQTVVAGAPATFSVSARSELPVTYQWQFGGVDIPGATNNTYTVASASFEQAGAYSVKVSNGVYTLTSTAFMNFSVLSIKLIPGLTLDAPAGSAWQIQYIETTGNLGSWITLTNLVLPSRPYLFVDTTATNAARRFYRAIPGP